MRLTSLALFAIAKTRGRSGPKTLGNSAVACLRGCAFRAKRPPTLKPDGRRAPGVALPKEIQDGVRHFNAGRFFEAHEAWEEHWGRGPPEERAATLGLIKAAVALHHLEAGNAAGFAWQAGEAVRNLRAHAAIWPELALAALADELESLVAQARFHGRMPDPFAPPRLPEK